MAVEAVSAGKAIDPVVLNTTKLTPIVDYFLICSGQTPIQVRAIADHLQDELDQAGVRMIRKEGGQEANWLLLDYGWLAVHIMLERSVSFTNWKDYGTTRKRLVLPAEETEV